MLVASDAGDRRLASCVGLGKGVDDLVAEAALVIQHVVRHADAFRHVARVLDVLAGAARPFAMGAGAVIVELQRHACDIVALVPEQGGDNGGIDAARHGDNHAGLAWRLGDIEAV